MENRLSFGLDAAGYRRFRPRYPAALYRFLAALAPDRSSALDCATGNGQAAVDLAAWFDAVDACDASAAQIAAAEPHDRVRYRVAASEDLPYGAGMFSLIAAAQGAHWFDLPAFFGEVRRVARPDAVLAIWGYSYCRVDDATDAAVERRLLTPIEPFWAAGNAVIRDHYRQIEFPFDEIAWPGFNSAETWSRAEYMSYLGTWSAVRKYREHNGEDPLAVLDQELAPDWPDGAVRPVTFEFVGRVGRIHADAGLAGR